MFRKSLSILLALVMVLSVFTVIPFSVFAQAVNFADLGVESTGNATFDRFINTYPWRDGDPWGVRGPEIAPYDFGSCGAYAADFTYYCYNTSPRDGSYFSSTSEIQAGDVIVLGNAGDGTGHWFVVLKRNGNSLYTAEGNVGGKVRIGWNYTIISSNRFSEDSRAMTEAIHHGSAPQYTSNPSNIVFELEKYSFYPDEHVTYYCGGTDVSYYIISIYDGNGNVLETPRVNPGEYCTRYYPVGTYTAYCEAYNNVGKTFSNTINFTIKDHERPSNIVFELEKYSFYPDEHVTYYCGGTDVLYYIISIYDGNGNVLETPRVNPGEYCTRYYPAGTYIAYCEAYNNVGKSFSNTITFTVKERTPEIHLTFDEAGIIGSKVSDISTKMWINNPDGIHMDSIGFCISTDQVHYDEIEIHTNKGWTSFYEEYKISDYYPIQPNHDYYVKYYVKANNTVYYSDSLHIKPIADHFSLGDVDGDEEVTIIDATCIQRKLANIPTANYIEDAADADEDGEVTIIDATAIQRHLAQLPSNENIGKAMS